MMLKANRPDDAAVHLCDPKLHSPGALAKSSTGNFDPAKRACTAA
jgi:hypothetical protein